jgi:hypothetical protein
MAVTFVRPLGNKFPQGFEALASNSKQSRMVAVLRERDLLNNFLGSFDIIRYCYSSKCISIGEEARFRCHHWTRLPGCNTRHLVTSYEGTKSGPLVAYLAVQKKRNAQYWATGHQSEIPQWSSALRSVKRWSKGMLRVYIGVHLPLFICFCRE